MAAAKKSTKKATSETKTPSKKTAAKKTAAPKQTASKPAPRRTRAVSGTLTPEERFRQIQDAAYYIAEKSDFQRDPTSCWVEAEALITRLNP